MDYRNRKQAKDTIEQRYPNFWVEFGRKGGQAKVKKGFAMNRDLAREAGRKGGQAPRKAK